MKSMEHRNYVLETWRLQCRVIGALVLRETRAAYGTSQLGYLWAIVTPVSSTALLVFIFTLAGRHPPFGESMPLFFVTGILVLGLFQKLITSLMASLDANKALMTYPPIKPVDVFLARTLLISATDALISIIIVFSLIWMQMAELPARLEEVMMGFFFMSLIGFGCGTISSVIFSRFESWKSVITILLRPLFFISAIFYVPSYLPPAALNWLAWNPVLQCIEWIRSGYYSNYDSRVLDKGYVVELALVLTLAGLVAERITRRKRS